VRTRRSGTRPLVVELAGLAGAGKSAIARALVRLDPTIHARPRLSRWSYAASLPALIPTLVRVHWPFRGVLTKEVKRILRVRALHRYARRLGDGGTLVFDEGPVYVLARMLVFGGDNIRTRGFERWWRRALAQWAPMLDAVVWVDAPDAVLAARIHNRSQWHPLQGAHSGEMNGFLHAYREAFRRVVGELCVNGGPRLWTIDTSRESVDQAAPALLARLGTLRGTAPLVAELAR
jgi:hypothetical protein